MNRKTQNPITTCARKIRHNSESEARAACRDGQSAYACRFCFGWHIGTATERDSRDITRRAKHDESNPYAGIAKGNFTKSDTPAGS